MAFRDQPLGELALTIPRASALFRQYDMDYCCGGKQTLARAASRKALDVAVIEAELAKLAEQPLSRDWRAGAPRGDYRPYHRSLSRPAP
ncbi:nitric oxide-dependent regulator DnrN or NorA [Klebsiella pneumoniae]|uniref:Nitric oxide-dependent regulator DnrN or NorA n=1 Tax=Klebsiella pneumoniae TaxID=573 RepID=A0AB74GL13_KLEPN|nr:nitric oxide-dependent regulator DnrN or NorA [Klebsiella pneumoniae]